MIIIRAVGWLSCALIALLFALAVGAMLSGCSSSPTQPTVVGSAPVTVVKVPVVQPCVEPDQVEALPESAMPARTAGADALAAGAAADLLRYRELARKQNDLLRACSTVTKGTP